MGRSAGVVVAAFLALGGLAAYLVGVGSLAETRRLHRVGVLVWALVKSRPAVRGDTTGASAPLLQFSTEQGAVLEVFSPVPSSRSRPLVDGAMVRIAYDPADPRKVLVLGRERRGVDRAFMVLGALLVLAALVLLFSAA
jgi:hypothetical protein